MRRSLFVPFAALALLFASIAARAQEPETPADCLKRVEQITNDCHQQITDEAVRCDTQAQNDYDRCIEPYQAAFNRDMAACSDDTDPILALTRYLCEDSCRQCFASAESYCQSILRSDRDVCSRDLPRKHAFCDQRLREMSNSCLGQ